MRPQSRSLTSTIRVWSLNLPAFERYRVYKLYTHSHNHYISLRLVTVLFHLSIICYQPNNGYKTLDRCSWFQLEPTGIVHLPHLLTLVSARWVCFKNHMLPPKPQPLWSRIFLGNLWRMILGSAWQGLGYRPRPSVGTENSYTNLPIMSQEYFFRV